MNGSNADCARAQSLSLFSPLCVGAALIAGAVFLPASASTHAILAGAIFPMASEAARMGRVRALAKEAARNRARERERIEREAYAQRLCHEARTAARKPPQSPEERERRRAATAHARDAETARLNAEICASAALASFRYQSETVRLRDEHVFWPSDAICQGQELPPLNNDGHVPGRDASGRVLGLVKGRLAYKRRTRLFAEIALLDALKLYAIIKTYPAEAERLAIVREARALFWDTLRAMQALDREHGLTARKLGGE